MLAVRPPGILTLPRKAGDVDTGFPGISPGSVMSGDTSKTTISAEQAGLTVAALLRQLLPGESWSDVRRVVGTRRVKIGGDLCLEPARRLKEGEVVELFARPLPPPRHED